MISLRTKEHTCRCVDSTEGENSQKMVQFREASKSRIYRIIDNDHPNCNCNHSCTHYIFIPLCVLWQVCLLDCNQSDREVRVTNSLGLVPLFFIYVPTPTKQQKIQLFLVYVKYSRNICEIFAKYLRKFRKKIKKNLNLRNFHQFFMNFLQILREF